jgi:DNA-3-methyladenine glycosylase II
LTLNRYDKKAAARYLVKSDPVLGRFIKIIGKVDSRARRESDVFLALARSIAYQQLSGKAANTIFQRFRALFIANKPDAARTSRLTFVQLRAVGLSGNKSLAIQDLAEKVLDGTLPTRRKLLRMPDDAVIEKLCEVRGIGPWTVQMYLMFNLGRADVMAITDLGLQRGAMNLYGLEEMPVPAQLQELSQPWAPYRSLASLYLWRAADTVLMNDLRND